MNELKEQGSKAYLISIVMVAVLGGLLFGYSDTTLLSSPAQRKVFRPSSKRHRTLITPMGGMGSLLQVP